MRLIKVAECLKFYKIYGLAHYPMHFCSNLYHVDLVVFGSKI